MNLFRLVALAFVLPIPLMVSIVLHSRFTAHYEEVLKSFKLAVTNAYFLGCIQDPDKTFHECREKADKYWEQDLLDER